MYPFVQSFENDESEYPHFSRILQLLAESPLLPHELNACDKSFSIEALGKKGRNREFWFSQANAQASASYQKGKACRLASSIQEHGLRLLKQCRFVESYVVRPAVVQFTLDGKIQRYLPDVAIECINGQMCFVNFMSRAALSNPDTVKRSQLLAMKLPALGYRYLIIIPEQIRLNSQGEPKSRSTASPLVRDCK